MTIPHFNSIKSFTIDSFWIGYFFLEVMAKQLLNYSKKLCLNCSTFSLLFQAWNPNGFIGKRPFWEGKPRHVALGDHCNLSDWEVAWNWQDIKMVVFSTVSPCPMGVPIFWTGPCCKFLTFLFFAISNFNSLVLKELEREIESFHFIQMHFSRENIFLEIK